MLYIIHRAKTASISRAKYEETNTRAKKRAFIERYNNVKVLDIVDGGWKIEASPYVVHGPNGLLMHGLCAEELGLGRGSEGYAVGVYIIKRDYDVAVLDVSNPDDPAVSAQTDSVIGASVVK